MRKIHLAQSSCPKRFAPWEPEIGGRLSFVPAASSDDRHGAKLRLGWSAAPGASRPLDDCRTNASRQIETDRSGFIGGGLRVTFRLAGKSKANSIATWIGLAYAAGPQFEAVDRQSRCGVLPALFPRDGMGQRVSSSGQLKMVSYLYHFASTPRLFSPKLLFPHATAFLITPLPYLSPIITTTLYFISTTTLHTLPSPTLHIPAPLTY